MIFELHNFGYSEYALKRMERNGEPPVVYEKPSIESVLKRFGSKGGSMLDIGAHIGYWSINCSEIFDEIHAYEPNPFLLHILSHNVYKYGNIQVHPYGVSEKEEMIDFSYVPNVLAGMLGSGAYSYEKRRASSGLMKDTPIESIKVFVAPPRVKKVNFIKIDVEGMESRVLEACSIYRDQNPLLHIEMHDEDRKSILEWVEIEEHIDEHFYYARYK
tara:strand:- start:145 stop:792 length:648 start_codon:yes stop_codon:yes gene_type:complete